jgi:hypothetical protein
MNGKGRDADGVGARRSGSPGSWATLTSCPTWLRKWCVHYLSKPAIMQNASDREDIVTMMLVDPYFQVNIDDLRL